ncbi:GDSL-type esterase/lipase family protein [Chitinophaga horti]|uniref:GDSL-type esterase/lipase family protein n=1 Tax=Chitinophaga horti TaxID=2920382 RepID=A0ABY6IWZ8_9BACT|nr:GDSL-type esterase/lipase family protein [Chitinophaga horti]UYQ91905.1 GDSL-type esterase/lipase family protein [Chitinophaga horti]
MRYRLVIIVVCLLVPFAARAQQPDTSYDNSHYRQRLAYFKQMPDRKHEIVFLGNSITEAGEWQELIPGKNVINRGISGDVTYGIKARLDEVLSSKPSKLFLLIGVNDMKRGHDVSAIAASYGQLVKAIVTASPKTKLYLQSVLPVHERMLQSTYKAVTNEKIKLLNRQIQSLATQYGLTYIDLHPVFADAAGQLDKELSTDGLHLQAAAYIKWVGFLKQQKYLR